MSSIPRCYPHPAEPIEEPEKEKEEDKRERTKESKEEEAHSLALVRACARVKDSKSALTKEDVRIIRNYSTSKKESAVLDRYLSSVPTLERAIDHARIHELGDLSYVVTWYSEMESALWADDDGKPIKNWTSCLKRWFLNRERFERLRDPDRIPDARKRSRGTSSGPRKADNYLPPDEDTIRSFSEVAP